MVETDRQIDLCSEHAKRPASVPGLWWCKRPIVGIGSGGRWWKSPVTIYQAPWRRAQRRCEWPVAASPHALDDASLDELRCEWRRLYRSEPPRISRDLLIRGIGYRLQEIQHGGLSKSTRRKLKTLAKMFRTEGRVAPDPGLSLKPGARLVANGTAALTRSP